MRLGLMRRAGRDWVRPTHGIMGRRWDTEKAKDLTQRSQRDGAQRSRRRSFGHTARISATLECAEPRDDNQQRDYAETAIDVSFCFAEADSGAAGANCRGGILRGGDFLLARAF